MAATFNLKNHPLLREFLAEFLGTFILMVSSVFDSVSVNGCQCANLCKDDYFRSSLAVTISMSDCKSCNPSLLNEE